MNRKYEVRGIKANGTCIWLIAQYNIQLGLERVAGGVSLQSAHYYLAAASLSVLFINLLQLSAVSHPGWVLCRGC